MPTPRHRRPSRRPSGRAPRRAPRRVLLGAVVLVVLAAGCRTYQPTETSWVVPLGAVSGAEVRSRAGLSPGIAAINDSDADLERALDAVAATGATWTTLDVDWHGIQADGPLSGNWTRTDRAVRAMRARGLKVIGVVGYSPTWAAIGGCPETERHCLPANPDDYGRFTAAAASRYGAGASDPTLRNGIRHWQIWNEPNHAPYARPKPDPGRYERMLDSAYRHIKMVDPGATVITGGTAPAPDAADGSDYSPQTWLFELYVRGAGDAFDAVGHHPAIYPSNPLDPQEWNAYANTVKLHDIMRFFGDGAKKVWGTETAAPTGTWSRALTEDEQALHLRDYYLGWNTRLHDITGPLVWMPVRDSGPDLSAREQNLGLLRRDWSEKPAYTMYRIMTVSGV